MTENLGALRAQLSTDEEDQLGGGYTDEDIKGRTPMGRFAKPEDIAQAVAFLAAPEQSGYVNGHTSPWTVAGSPTGAGRVCGTVSRACSRALTLLASR